MIDVAILRAMAASGATVDVVIAAVEAAQARQHEKLVMRRSQDAKRQKRHRIRNAESRGVTRTDRDTPSPMVSPNTPSLTLPPSYSKPKKVSRMAVEIPSDFSPDISFAESKGWTRERAQSEAHRFADHALSKGRKCKDWPAAWRNWVTSPYQPGKVNGHAGRIVEEFERQPGESLGSLGKRLYAEARRLEDQAGVRRADDTFGRD